jgi:hypothetical protein
MKVRDVARRLVMSESDLYRKQRAAFEEVARIIAEMEREARRRERQQTFVNPTTQSSSPPTVVEKLENVANG